MMNFVVLLLFSEFVMQFSEICDRFCDAVGQELSLSEVFLCECSLHFDSSSNFPCPTFYLVTIAYEQSVNISGNRSKLDRKEKR